MREGGGGNIHVWYSRDRRVVSHVPAYLGYFDFTL